MVNATSIGRYVSTPKGKLLLTEMSVFITFVLMVFVFVSRIVRRRYRSTFLKASSSGAYVAITLFIPSILGFMQSLSYNNELLSVWAFLLVYVSFLLQKTFYSKNGPTVVETCFNFCTYVAYLNLMYPGDTSLTGLFLIMLAPLFIISEIAATHGRLKPKDYHLEQWRRFSRMHVDDLVFPKEIDPNLIHDMEEEGCIMSSKKDRSHHLKTKYFSFHLFYRLLNKIIGAPSFGRSYHQDSCKWLLEPTSSEISRPFRVIEVELSLLYDFLYQKTCYVLYDTNGSPWTMVIRSQPFFGLGTFVLLFTTFKTYNPGVQATRTQFGKCDVDVLLTWIVLTATIMLQLIDHITRFISRWSIMPILDIYVSRRSWRNAKVLDRCIKTATEAILCLGHDELFKPWQRKLGQYCLLKSCSFMHGWECLASMLNTATGNRFLQVGRKESRSVAVSESLKNVIVQTLQNNNHHLTNGIATLKASGLPLETQNILTSTCNQLQTDAEVVLVWHIATSLCEISRTSQPSNASGDTDNYHVASTLSKYCAYLVAFAPDLLPGNPTATENICTLAIRDAHAILKHCKLSEIYSKFLDIAREDNGESEAGQGGNNDVVKQGAILGKVLNTEIKDSSQMWKLLAEFWVGTILYLAPNEYNDFAHLERLKDGGEFITHLWALLFHIGIFGRDSLGNVPNMASGGTSGPLATTSST